MELRPGRDVASGFVLAGGRSSRMGQDKARLPWRGTTLVESVTSVLMEVTNPVAIVGGDPVPGWLYIPDRWPGFGPVGGITSALISSTNDYSLVVACDMPNLEAGFLRRLVESAAGHAVAVPKTADGRIHPLCA